MKSEKRATIVVSALNVRTSFGKLLLHYVRLAAPGPEVLCVIGGGIQAQRHG